MMNIVYNTKIHLILICILLGSLCENSAAFAQSVHEDAKMQYYLEKIGDKSFDISLKLPLFDTIIKFYTKKKAFDKARNYSLDKIKLLNRNGSYLEAHNTCLHIIDDIENSQYISKNEYSTLAQAKLLLAKSCIYLGIYDESISQLLDLLKTPDSASLSETYSYLGYVFMLTNQMVESKKYNLKALENLALENPKLVPEKASNVYNNCGGFYYTQNQFDSALYYLNLSAKSHEINHNQSQQVYVYHNMSIIYQEMGEYEIGKEYLQKAITLAKDTKLPYTQTICLQNLAYLYYEKKEYTNSLIYYNQALDLAKKTNIPKIESSILIEMSDVFYQLNHFKKACEYKKKGILLGDSIFGNSKMDRIIALSQQFELYKIKTEKKLLSKKLLLSQISTSKKNIVLGILVTLLILLTIVTYFVIYKIKKQSEQNSQLEDQLACIHQEDNAKIQSISKKYEPIIEQKNRELTVNALFLIRVNDLLYKLKKNINQQLNAKDTLSRASFNKEMADILKSYNPNKGWEEFKLYFEQIHHSFYTKLNEINPNLSQMEERLCALLVLNMTTKEIADLTHRSERTIETIIYKIRKKLNIPPQEKTTLFLKKWVYHNDKPIKNNL